jgi:putative flippase GtrA
MIALLRSQPDLRRFLLFLAAGALNTAFGYAAFAFFIWMGTGNDLAVLCGTLAGIVFNFNTFSRVFASQGMSRLPRFLAFYGILMLVNIALLRLMSTAGFGPYLGQGLVLVIITPCSFLAMRRIVFPPLRETSP